MGPLLAVDDGAVSLCEALVDDSSGAPEWVVDVLATDVANPLDNGDAFGFGDGSVRPGTNVLTCAYSLLQGLNVIHRDIAARNVLSNETVDNTPGSGAFIHLAMLGDGSVRIAQYNPREKRVCFETGDIPIEEQFTALPAVQLGPDEDCDDVCFFVSPDADTAGLHDTAVGVLSSSMVVATGGSKKEFKGHVTLMK